MLSSLFHHELTNFSSDSLEILGLVHQSRKALEATRGFQHVEEAQGLWWPLFRLIMILQMNMKMSSKCSSRSIIIVV